MCRRLWLELVPRPMSEKGPDMDLEEELVKDPAVRHVVRSKYSNPTDVTRSKPASYIRAETRRAGFALMWDNAQRFTRSTATNRRFRHDGLAASGNADLVYDSPPRARCLRGAAAYPASPRARAPSLILGSDLSDIGPNKVNELLHVRFLKNLDNTLRHEEARAIIEPKFDSFAEALSARSIPQKSLSGIVQGRLFP